MWRILTTMVQLRLTVKMKICCMAISLMVQLSFILCHCELNSRVMKFGNGFNLKNFLYLTNFCKMIKITFKSNPPNLKSISQRYCDNLHRDIHEKTQNPSVPPLISYARYCSFFPFKSCDRGILPSSFNAIKWQKDQVGVCLFQIHTLLILIIRVS